MTANDGWIEVDAERVAHVLEHEGVEKVNAAEGEVTLDFRAVARIDASGVRALEELAVLADGKGVRVALRGVNRDIYKVLKLLKLAERFSFGN